MAEGTRLVLGFKDSSDNDFTFMFNYAKPSASLTNVRSLMNTIIENGDIFKRVPVTAVSAKTVTTSENVYSV